MGQVVVSDSSPDQTETRNVFAVLRQRSNERTDTDNGLALLTLQCNNTAYRKKVTTSAQSQVKSDIFLNALSVVDKQAYVFLSTRPVRRCVLLLKFYGSGGRKPATADNKADTHCKTYNSRGSGESLKKTKTNPPQSELKQC